MDDAERSRIISEAYDTLERLNNVERLDDYRRSQPVESPADKYIRQREETQRKAQEQAKQSTEDERQERLAYIEMQFTALRDEVSNMLDTQKEFIIEVIGAALGELQDQWRQKLLEEVERVRAEYRAQREVDLAKHSNKSDDDRSVPDPAATRRIQ
jgi:hypothetical protein